MLRDYIYVYVLHGTSGNRYFQLVASTGFISNIYSGLKNTYWTLLRLLVLRRSSRRLTVKPHDHKSKESSNHRPQASNPDPTAADSPAARILIVRIVANGDFMLLFDVGEERALVVNAEREDSVLIGDGESCAVDGAVFRPAGGLESEAVEGREHGKFKLQRIFRGNLEGDVFIIDVFGDFNIKDLEHSVSIRHITNAITVTLQTYSLVLDPVKRGVQFRNRGFSQVMLNLPNFQHPSFLERPSSQLLGKLLVDGLAFVTRGRLYTRRKPLVLQALHGAQNSEPRRIPRLHG